MIKIAIIKDTGNAQANAIFQGVFGAMDGTTFKVDDSLKRIHLFQLLTPEALAAQGIDFADNIAEIQVPDSLALGMKTTLMSELKQGWLSMYATSLAGMPSGFAQAALTAERDSVARAVDAAIEATGLSCQPIQLSVFFNNIEPNVVDVDEEGEELISGGGGSYLKSSELAQSLQESGGWRVLEKQEQYCASGFTNRYETTSAYPYASGHLLTTLPVYANGAVDGYSFRAEAEMIAQVIADLPKEITQRMGLADRAEFSRVEFHNDFRPQPGDEVLQLNAPAADAPAA